MTLLLQENRICRAGKKAIPHKWEDYFVQRGFDDALVENMQPCLVQGRNGATGLQPGGITKWRLIYSTLLTDTHLVVSTIDISSNIIHVFFYFVNQESIQFVEFSSSGMLLP
jgi:hypothetical protein